MIRRLWVVVLLLLLHGGASAQAPSPRLRVLFIGNSYTYFNNLPDLFAHLAASTPNPKQVDTQMVVEGGATLQKLWDEGNARTAIRQGHWDFVVLQEQSTLGEAGVINGIAQINKPAAFYQAARLFDSEIKQAGARTVFFLTWARQNSPESQVKLNSAYETIAREVGARLAPVGPAWQKALQKDPKLALHQSDKSHPTPAGSYLAACVFYAVFFGESPAGAAHRVLGRPVDGAGRPIALESSSGNSTELANLPTAEAAFLQAIAWQTVQEFRTAARSGLSEPYSCFISGGFVSSRRRRAGGAVSGAVESCVPVPLDALAASSEVLYLGSLTYP